ncbi:hypothetical protein ACFE04_007208 [Oxalis oulophora]
MNTRKYCNLVVVLLLHFYLLVYTTAAADDQVYRESAGARTLKQAQEGNHDHEVHCSRERSRAAWRIVNEYLMPVVEKERYQISKNCRLHPENDLYRDQEQHKSQVDLHEWQCGYCRKIFYEEKHLDLHMDNRHYNLLNLSSSKCLADACGALHCDTVLDTTPHKKTKCNPAAASRNKHLCESLANSCFPVSEGPSASRLHRKVPHYVISHVNSFYANSVMHIHALENKSHSLKGEGGIRTGTQQLKRITKSGGKKKPY